MALSVNFDGVLGRVLTVILGVVVSLIVIAALLPIFFDQVASVVENLTSNVTTGDPASDALLLAFAPIIAIIASVTILRFILRSIRS